MASINTASLFAAFDRFAASHVSAAEQLCAALREQGIKTREAAQPHVSAWAAQRTGCALVEGQKSAKGRVVLDRTHKSYEAAKKAAQRLLDAISDKPAKQPRASAHKVVTVTRAQRAAAMAFLAEFDGDSLEAQIRAARAALQALVA